MDSIGDIAHISPNLAKVVERLESRCAAYCREVEALQRMIQQFPDSPKTGSRLWRLADIRKRLLPAVHQQLSGTL